MSDRLVQPTADAAVDLQETHAARESAFGIELLSSVSDGHLSDGIVDVSRSELQSDRRVAADVGQSEAFENADAVQQSNHGLARCAVRSDRVAHALAGQERTEASAGSIRATEAFGLVELSSLVEHRRQSVVESTVERLPIGHSGHTRFSTRGTREEELARLSRTCPLNSCRFTNEKHSLSSPFDEMKGGVVTAQSNSI